MEVQAVSKAGRQWEGREELAGEARRGWGELGGGRGGREDCRHVFLQAAVDWAFSAALWQAPAYP